VSIFENYAYVLIVVHKGFRRFNIKL